MEIQIVTSVRNQFVIMNGHAIAMGLFKKDDAKKEAEKMLKKMGKEAEGKVRMYNVRHGLDGK